MGRVFTHELVREEAKYTCHNWFLKIAGNRSLLGRIYLEAALARSHHFLIGSTHQNELHDSVFLRLAKMCRGIAHPVTCNFARMYVSTPTLLPPPPHLLPLSFDLTSYLYRKAPLEAGN